MLSFQEARDIAAKIVEQSGSSNRYDIIIIDAHIIETPYAWVFPYNTRGALEGDIFCALGGNSPVFVSKKDGTVSTFPSYLTTERMIDQYEEEREIGHLKLITNVYAEVAKLLKLKQVLNLSQEELANLKVNQNPTICKGSKTRLDKLAALLAENGIHIFLNA